MALFKIFKGKRQGLDSIGKIDGHAYFCTDDGSFWIDFDSKEKDAEGNSIIIRKQLNAKDAETICGVSLEELNKQMKEVYIDPLEEKIKDCPRTEVAWKEIANGTYTSEVREDAYGLYGAQIYYTETIEIPEVMSAVFNDVEYNNLPVKWLAELNMPCIGNLSKCNILGLSYPDTGEPFFVALGVIGGVLFTDLIQSSTHKIALSIPVENIIKLDEKYIPDDLDVIDRLKAELNGEVLTATINITTANTTIYFKIENQVEINWGDGTISRSIDYPYYTNHTYAEVGEYVCKIYGVTHINIGMFNDCHNLTSIEIPNSVTTIDDSIFSGCHGLTSVVIPDSVTLIGEYAFSNCSSLTSIEIPNSVATIYDYAFNNCTSLTSVVIPDSVTNIVGRIFYFCSNLESVVFNNHTPIIHEDFFDYCDKLTTIYVPYGCAEAYKAKLIADGAGQDILDKIVESDREAMMSDLNSMKVHIDVNIENGTGTGAIQQIADGVADGFDFTDKNYSAESYDSSLSGVIPYGATGDFAVSLGGKSSAQGKRSTAEGTTTIAIGNYSHTEGNATVTFGANSHAEGAQTAAIGGTSHAEGKGSAAYGEVSHAEGISTDAIGVASHAEGEFTIAEGTNSHAEGTHTYAKNYSSHASGYKTQTNRDSQTVCGEFNIGKANTLFEIGNGTEVGGRFNAFEVYDTATVAVGKQVQQIQDQESGVTEGYFNFTDKNPNATALDGELTGEIQYGATGAYSSSFGGKSAAIGKRAHAEGTTTIAKGAYSHAEGNNSVTLGANSHAEGKRTTTLGENAHAEGFDTLAEGYISHSEGYKTHAKGTVSHAEGQETVAEGDQAHAEGRGTIAEGHYSHTEGFGTKAIGKASHASGEGTVALGDYQTVVGRYNFPVSEALANGVESQILFIVGNGTSDEDRNIAFVVLDNGEAISNYIDEPSEDCSLINRLQFEDLLSKRTTTHLRNGNGTCSVQGHNSSIADYAYDFAFGEGIGTTYEHQTVFGRYNDTSNWSNNRPLFMIGNGTDADNRSNAFEVLADGRVKAYGTPLEDNDLVTVAFMKQYIQDNFATLMAQYIADPNNAVTATDISKIFNEEEA